MKPEYHLFIIWPKARYIEDKIIEDIKYKFDVVDLCEIYWSKHNFSNNLTRFYGEKLPDGSHKERHCGRGPFILVVVKDMNPTYEKRDTSKGVKFVNVNLFDAKSIYRKWTGGGHRIHATNSPDETKHDLVLLFGMDAEKYYSDDIANLYIRNFKQDLVGADGWKSIDELFYVLNNTINYVVLRNFECLPDNYTMKSHGDIDLLVNSYNEITYIANATKVFRSKYRVHHKVKVGENDILFDFRHIGDNYYDEPWEKDILERRRISPRGVYVPASEDYFFSLLYHGLVHKPEIGQDYRERLINLAPKIGVESIDMELFRNTDALKTLLIDYLARHGYSFTEPDDLSVYYNEKIVGKRRMSFQRRIIMEIKNVLRPLKDPVRLTKDVIIWLYESIMQLKLKTIGR